MDGEGFLMIALVVACLSFGFGCGVGSAHSDEWWKRDAIRRGNAIYCPDDGEFAFIGECE